MYLLKFILFLFGTRCLAEDAAFSDVGKHRGGLFPWKIDRPAPLFSNNTINKPYNLTRERKNSENSTVVQSSGENGTLTELNVQIVEAEKIPNNSSGGNFENQTGETRYYERHGNPEANEFGYRKRIKQNENYDYIYEYETGDYYWKRKSVRVVTPERKNNSDYQENSSAMILPNESFVKEPQILEPRILEPEVVLATEIPDPKISQPYLDLVQFDEKYFSCPDNINETYPITGYCNRYVACISGKPYPGVCRGGLHFDLLKKTCDLPSNSFCNYACPKENGYFGVPGECNGFFSCRNWYPRYRTCPPHKHWDPEKEICTDDENSSCPLKCNVPYEVKPYEGDCRSYVICEKSQASYRRCPADTRFDLKSLGCVPKNSTECPLHPKLMTFRDYSEKNICASIGFKGEYFTWCKETLSSTSAPDTQSTSD